MRHNAAFFLSIAINLHPSNVEVSCGPDGCQACMALYENPPHYTPSAPLV
jgi:hypothetical protein